MSDRPTPSCPLSDEPVAVRYRDRNGRWRYLNLPFTKGWEFPMILGTPIPLYERAVLAAAGGSPAVHLSDVENVLTAIGMGSADRDYVLERLRSTAGGSRVARARWCGWPTSRNRRTSGALVLAAIW